MRNPFLLSFFLLFCAITQHLSAQKSYLFKHYTVKDGLPNNTIYSINQDRNGYLWIATDGGICRFDGSKFDNSILPELNNNQTCVQHIDKLPDGKLALATFMQGTFVEKNNGTFRQYLRRKKMIGKNVVSNLRALPDGRVLTSESRNVNVVENDTIHQIFDCGENRNMFQTLEYDCSQNIWFGGINGLGILFSNGNRNEKEPFILPELKDIFVVKIIFISRSKLLVGTKSGYFEVNIQSGNKNDFKYTVSKPIPELDEEVINNVYPDRQGDIWIASVFNGVYRLRNNKIIQHLTISNGLHTTGAMCVYQDNEGNYWIGTSDGLSKLDNFSSFSYNFRNKPLAGIAQISKDKFGRIWVASQNEILLIKGDSIESKNMGEVPFLKNREIKSIDFNKDNIYFFLDNGIYTLPLSNPQKWSSLSLIVRYKDWEFGRLNSYLFDDNVLWLGSEYGMYYVRDKKIIKCPFGQFKETENIKPNVIQKDRSGNYWFGDKSYGLYGFRIKETMKDNETILIPDNIKVFKSLKADSSFVTAWVMSLMQDSNDYFWMSSLYTGIYKLQNTGSGMKVVKFYSAVNGLSSNDVSNIVEAPDKSIWITTAKGIDRLSVDSQRKEKWEHYNEKNGFGRLAYCILPDEDKTYAGYEEGFYAIDNKPTQNSGFVKSNVKISEIRLMNKADTSATNNLSKVKRLSYSNNYISFYFSTITFTRNSEVKYQYYLDGLETKWNSYSDRRFAEYSALPPGKYTFFVRCKRDGSDIESEASSYSFVITPPYYQTWWFISLNVMLAAGILFFFYRNRIRQLIEMEKMRNRIASDLHDDIGSTLSSISIMSNVLQTQIDNSSHSGEMIQKIGENAHTMLESMDDIIWSVNPANDKFENLNLRIKEYAIPLFESSGIDFQILVPEELNTITLSMDVRRNIFLICKEAINNLVKYSSGTKADITFNLDHSILTITVKDNGIGFKTDKTSNRNGLKNMKRRALQIGGELIVDSEINKGTSITLSIKIS